MRKTLSILFFTLLLCPALFGIGQKFIYIVSAGKHSGIAMPHKYADMSYISNRQKYEDEKFIEYGYGEREYYMSKTPPSLLTGAKAVLWPNNSVIRLSKYKIQENSINSENATEIKKIYLSEKQLNRLNQFIKKSFKLEDNLAKPIGYSKYGDGNFFAGSRDFYLFNTCNTWVAKALKYSGFDINTSFIVTKNNLYNALKNSPSLHFE